MSLDRKTKGYVVYGDLKDSYRVRVEEDGRLSVCVCHANKRIRTEIEKNKHNPTWFIQLLKFSEYSPRAKSSGEGREGLSAILPIRQGGFQYMLLRTRWHGDDSCSNRARGISQSLEGRKFGGLTIPAPSK